MVRVITYELHTVITMEVFMSLENVRNKEAVNEFVFESASRKPKGEVSYANSELKQLVAEWLKNEGWKSKDFATFVELVGIKTPARISDFNADNYSFKCTTADNTEVTITFRFGSIMDEVSEILVTEAEETRCYYINGNFKGNSLPKVTLSSRTIAKDGKNLYSYYSEYFCHRELYFNPTHKLKVEIPEPNGGERKNYNAAVLRNHKQVEEYLLGLDSSLVLSEVYDRFMELLGFSDEDVLNCKEIYFSYIETTNTGEEQVRSKIHKKRGQMQDYAVLEDGETFEVSRDGNWNYFSDNITIQYSKINDSYVFSVTGKELSIKTANPTETLIRVKTRISELMEFVK